MMSLRSFWFAAERGILISVDLDCYRNNSAYQLSREGSGNVVGPSAYARNMFVRLNCSHVFIVRTKGYMKCGSLQQNATCNV